LPLTIHLKVGEGKGKRDSCAVPGSSLIHVHHDVNRNGKMLIAARALGFVLLETTMALGTS